MKLNTSYVIAGALVIIGASWFAFNNAGDAPAVVGTTAAQAQDKLKSDLPTVRVRNLRAVEHPNVLELYGQTRANREVAVKAETAGLVASVGVVEGARVTAGQTLCRQDLNARQAMVDQAKANLRSIETDLNAARVLAEKGFQSSTRVTAFEAQLDGARAALKQAEIEADNVNIRAPFNGIWERQDAQIGDYLAPGQACGLLVDLSPLEVSVQLTEAQVGSVEAGDVADITLATGQKVAGKLNYVEAKADPATRTFRAELLVPNSDYKLKAGVTATVHMEVGKTMAQQIPSNILTLDNEGNIGVRYVDASARVRFAKITTIDETQDGVWVTGLPDQAQVIFEGQDFVAVGQEVAADATYGTNTQINPLTSVASGATE